MSGRLQEARLHPARLLPLAAPPRNKDEELWVELGFPGLDPAEPSLDIVDFDHSGSVTAIGGNDPIGNRFQEAELAFKVVAKWCATKRSKAAVIHFDQPSNGNSGVVPLSNPDSLAILNGALKVPWNAAGTSDLSPSLAKAEKLAATHPGHDIRLTILSDFELTDAEPDKVFARLAAFPGQVHAVVLGAEPPTDLRGENITITRLGYDDPPGALAAAIHRSLTATRRGRRLSAIHADRTRPSIPPLSLESNSAGAVDPTTQSAIPKLPTGPDVDPR